MDSIPNILATRYASKELKAIWSPRAKVLLERTFWMAVLKAQKELGLDVSDEVINAYERVKDTIDLESIARREAVTHHDVKAKIDEFCDLAGHQHIHKGMTSRDLTENVEQLQVYKSLKLVQEKAISALSLIAEKAVEYKDMPIAARTHNVAAQVTTLGKRLAMFGEELLRAIEQIEHLIDTYPFRGLKGAVGTQLDPIYLFGGDIEKAQALENAIVKHLGGPKVLNAVGQVYPRSLDFEVVSALFQLACGPVDFANTLRLMAGHELVSEGFAKGQVGSSAMPHKINARSCERMRGFYTILKGYLSMASGIAGDQWNEGDVACSVVRRVLLPDAFFAIDGLLETFLTVLSQMEVFGAMVDQESEHYLPFLLTTQFLMEAVKQGAGREVAHEAIKEHALATVEALRSGRIITNNLVQRLAEDSRLNISRKSLDVILSQGRQRIGAAMNQVDSFVESVEVWRVRYPQASKYEPAPLL